LGTALLLLPCWNLVSAFVLQRRLWHRSTYLIKLSRVCRPPKFYSCLYFYSKIERCVKLPFKYWKSFDFQYCYHCNILYSDSIPTCNLLST
jgi:hypothetical protein